MTQLYRLLFGLLLSTVVPPVVSLADSVLVATVAVDEEYDRYRRQGDELFRQGRYLDARRQYLNCLEVPGFEDDLYAKDQLDKCNTGLSLRQKADDALQQGRAGEAVGLYGQLLTLNPDDAATKLQLADYYEREGNRLFNQQQYAAAKESYNRALSYTLTRQETLRLQIQRINGTLFPPPKRIGLKLVTGMLGVGAGVYALLLQSDFQSKLTTLNRVSQTTDPDNDDVINTSVLKQQYEAAYEATKAAQQKSSVYKACLGVAAVATMAEAYLLLHKPKAQPRSRTIRWQPASESWGLALRYDF